MLKNKENDNNLSCAMFDLQNCIRRTRQTECNRHDEIEIIVHLTNHNITFRLAYKLSKTPK